MKIQELFKRFGSVSAGAFQTEAFPFFSLAKWSVLNLNFELWITLILSTTEIGTIEKMSRSPVPSHVPACKIPHLSPPLHILTFSQFHLLSRGGSVQLRQPAHAVIRRDRCKRTVGDCSRFLSKSIANQCQARNDKPS